MNRLRVQRVRAHNTKCETEYSNFKCVPSSNTCSNKRRMYHSLISEVRYLIDAAAAPGLRRARRYPFVLSNACVVLVERRKRMQPH